MDLVALRHPILLAGRDVRLGLLNELPVRALRLLQLQATVLGLVSSRLVFLVSSYQVHIGLATQVEALLIVPRLGLLLFLAVQDGVLGDVRVGWI